MSIAAVLVDRRLDHLVGRGVVLEVGGDDDPLAAGGLDRVETFLQLRLGARGGDDLGALAPEQLERGAADAAAGARDDRDLVGDAAATASLTHVSPPLAMTTAFDTRRRGRDARPPLFAAALG